MHLADLERIGIRTTVHDCLLVNTMKSAGVQPGERASKLRCN